MNLEDAVRRHPSIRNLNSAYFRYRQHRWRWSREFRSDDESVEIDRPIFLLGTQGGGLTIISRILRRLPEVISVTGNHRYWAGDDETQNVLTSALPPELSWRDFQAPGYNTAGHNWIYGCDDYLPRASSDTCSIV